MMKKLIFVLAAIMLTFSSMVSAQETSSFEDYKVNLMFGINQPLLGGFNIEGNLFYKRLVFDYSHGVSLNFSNEILDEDNKNQGLAVHIPWTTGLGVGYRINNWLNVRVEPKWHRFELYYDGDAQNGGNLINAYNTFSMGAGLYANIQPFKKQNNFLKGIMVAPSIRWWPRVSSTLENDEFTYNNRSTQSEVTHKAMEVGVNNTPLIVNISVGYSFNWKKNKQ